MSSSESSSEGESVGGKGFGVWAWRTQRLGGETQIDKHIQGAAVSPTQRQYMDWTSQPAVSAGHNHPINPCLN